MEGPGKADVEGRDDSCARRGVVFFSVGEYVIMFLLSK